MTEPPVPWAQTSTGAFGRQERGKVRLSRAGAHWFDRQTGLNILLDRVAIPAHRWSRAPRYVSIALTNTCELRCPFCYAPKDPSRLASEVVLAWMEELDAAGCLGVGFGGGEPTAHPEFAWICAEAARRTQLAVTFTTHGHRVDELLADALRGNVHFVRVSMDGVGSTYERLRGRLFKAFQCRLDVVATVAPFGLNVVINDETVEELDAIVSFARDVGAAEVLLLPEQPARGRPGISTSTSERLTDWVLGANPGVRLAISRAGVTEAMPLADPFGHEGPLEAHAHVDAHGVLKPNAYATEGVLITNSILESLDELRAERTV